MPKRTAAQPTLDFTPNGQEHIVIRGARVHNLKNIDVDIPRDKLVVITGLSGSGKSSLAFDTIYAEGQRRYVESLSAYARQFLDVMERPDVDYIEGLSPAISIEQKTVSNNPRSTVGTVTEIYDYLRLLFARCGTQYCYNCGRRVTKQTTDQIIDSIMKLPEGTKVQILAPVVKGRKGHYRELFEEILKDGFLRVRIDGVVKEISKGLQADRYKVHNIEIVVDRIVVKKEARSRIADSVEVALRFGAGVAIANVDRNGAAEQPKALTKSLSKKKSVQPKQAGEDILFSRHLSCAFCNISYEDPAPNSFSFNSPYGSCPTCDGLGEIKELDLDLIIPDTSLTINQEGLAPLGKPRQTWAWSQVRAIAKRYRFDFDTPVGKIPKKAKDVLLYGAGDEKFEIEYRYQSGRTVMYKHRFGGLLDVLKHYYDEASSNNIREWVEAYMNTKPCSDCHGGRLKKESLAVKLADAVTKKEFSIHDVVSLSIEEGAKFFKDLKLTDRQMLIATQILKEIRQRLEFLHNVGLDYLTLDRSARSLSGGEGQRIRLATQIGSQLVGVLYILDEPSIGLHQRDNIKLIDSLKSLRDLGNTVVVVEHDKEMIESADYVLDLGPGAGEHGGYVVTSGHPSQLELRNDTIHTNGDSVFDSVSYTAQYLFRKRRIETPKERRKGNGKFITLEGARGNNLRSVTLKIPLGTFMCVTGVSGSGKSSLIGETLYPILSRKFYQAKLVPLPYKNIDGLQHVDKVVDIDQSPIGRTPRSNPATYTGAFGLIRDLFTQLPEAKIRGYKPGRFSFNVAGGRCENCEGDGVKKIEMNFLPDVYVLCDVCKGKRYNRETLQVLYKGKSIADVLDMTVSEAVGFFSEIPGLQRKLSTLNDVGLGYIRLGQQATTLSGGEAQRVKLSTELSKIGTGNTLYILDEPTTGLHFEDIRMLLNVLNRLVEKGNTVVVIEHNLDVIKTADWVIDLGPGGGKSGGNIVAEGTPEAVTKAGSSATGKFLRSELS
ncbi:MAG: excinuclease ABC subunit UvrA [Bacteroidetes bacterium]|nr:excinuclease ABC subunit UvrA [Bacteroidota bacterium]MCW5894025.1 excinuclease ABC subunit UvrA [Bacteroidota bacterium]